MTDDKALKEAGLAYAKANPFLTREDHDEAMRAALAAADKVRAEGFDATGESKVFCNQYGCAGQNDLAEILRAAFAAGLAKGEADRAALVEERTKLSKKNVELQRGDLIEVKRIELHGAIVKDRWLLASIVKIVGHSILAIGISNDNLNVQKWFSLSERGNTWR